MLADQDVTPRPALRVVLSGEPAPRLELPRARPRWVDSPWFGGLLVTAMFTGLLLAAVAMGWLS